MNTNTITYTLGNSSAGFGLPVEQGERPKDPPKGLIITRAVQTKAGWVGQVIVDKEIVYETEVCDDGDEAQEEANTYVVDRVKNLFTPKKQR